MLNIDKKLSIPDVEIVLNAIRSQGAGGQNVNKVSSAIHLRFDIQASSLPDTIKQRLLAMHDRRITAEGVVIIKAQAHRTQDKNRTDALKRLADLIRSATHVPRRRIATRPGPAAKRKRLDVKKKRGSLKKLRSRPLDQ